MFMLELSVKGEMCRWLKLSAIVCHLSLHVTTSPLFTAGDDEKLHDYLNTPFFKIEDRKQNDLNPCSNFQDNFSDEPKC